MFHFCLHSLAFTLLCYLCYFFTNAGIGSWEERWEWINFRYLKGGYGNTYSRLQEAKDYGPVDYVILGSSHAYRGIDTRYFEAEGLQAFNYGSSSQTPVQSDFLHEHYCPQTPAKHILIEVFPEMFAFPELESTLDLCTNAPLTPALLTLPFRQPDLLAVHVLHYRLYRELFALDRDFEEAWHKPHLKDQYISGGYVEKDMKRSRLNYYEPTNITTRPDALRALERLIRRCHIQGQSVSLLFAPIPKYYYEAHNFEDLDQYFRQLERSGQVDAYWNFNGLAIIVDSLHYYDHHHLNQEGVAHFNTALIDSIHAL